jgi:hypothetical protein
MVDLNGDPGSCDVCERSMLAGETTRAYLTRDRDERQVCDLCVVRAESAGWVSRELAGAALPERREGRGVRRLLGRARGGGRDRSAARDESTERVREGGGGASTQTRPRPRVRRREEPAPEPQLEPAPASVSAPTPELEEEPRPAAPQEVVAEERPRRRSVPQDPKRRISRALDHFNESEHKRTVRGLIRSLGGPYVCAVTSNDTPNEVRITVAWELSWYQYEVDLTSDGEAVRELERGDELGQLDAEDQAWNAHAAEDGELRPGLIGSDTGG